MKLSQTVVLLLAVCGPAWADEPDRAYFKKDLLFYASFDRSTDADFARGDARCAETGEPELVDGRFGRALLFSSRVRACCQYQAEKNLQSDQGTIAFYFRPEWSGGDYQHRHFFFYPGIRNPHAGVNAPDSMGIHTKRYRKPDQEIWLWYDDHGGGNNIVKSPIASWRAGQWHHVAVTWDAQWLRVYLDGKLTGQHPAGGRITEPGEAFFVGSSRNGHAPSGGALDEFYVYGRPLSLAEIGLLTGQPRFLTPGIVSLEPEQTLFFRSERRVPFRCELAGRIDPDKHGLRAALIPQDEDGPIASADCAVGSEGHSLELPHPVPEGFYRLRVLLIDAAGNVLDEESILLRVLAGPFDEDDSLSTPNGRGCQKPAGSSA